MKRFLFGVIAHPNRTQKGALVDASLNRFYLLFLPLGQGRHNGVSDLGELSRAFCVRVALHDSIHFLLRFFNPVLVLKQLTLLKPPYLVRLRENLNPHLLTLLHGAEVLKQSGERVNLVFFFRFLVQPIVHIGHNRVRVGLLENKVSPPHKVARRVKCLFLRVVLNFNDFHGGILCIQLGLKHILIFCPGPHIEMHIASEGRNLVGKPWADFSVPIGFHIVNASGLVHRHEKKLHRLRRFRNLFWYPYFKKHFPRFLDVVKPDIPHPQFHKEFEEKEREPHRGPLIQSAPQSAPQRRKRRFSVREEKDESGAHRKNEGAQKEKPSRAVMFARNDGQLISKLARDSNEL